MNSEVIAIINQKGGVGKTTTAINLSAALGLKNQKVLIIDTDPQGNISSGLNINKNNLKYSIYELFININRLNSNEVIIKNVSKNVDVLPSKNNFTLIDQLIIRNYNQIKNLFSNLLAFFKTKYNYIIIDCSPSTKLINQLVLSCVDSVIIPVQTEFFAVEGLKNLILTIEKIKRNFNNNLTIKGILMTMVRDNFKIAKNIYNSLYDNFGSIIFRSYIPRCISLSDSNYYQCSVFEYDNKSSGAISYDDLSKELLSLKNIFYGGQKR